MEKSHRLRIGRHSAPGQIYLITSICHRRRAYLAGFERARAVVRAFQAAELRADTLCFVVMPDHFHWLMQLKPDGHLSSTMQFVKSFATRQLRTLGLPTERIWQPGFHDRAIRREDDLRSVARYVVANPVRAGLAKSVRSYSFWDAAWI